jgi:hypothetical protein
MCHGTVIDVGRGLGCNTVNWEIFEAGFFRGYTAFELQNYIYRISIVTDNLYGNRETTFAVLTIVRIKNVLNAWPRPRGCWHYADCCIRFLCVEQEIGCRYASIYCLPQVALVPACSITRITVHFGYTSMLHLIFAGSVLMVGCNIFYTF